MSLFSVLLHGRKGEYMMKSMNGTDKTKGLCCGHSGTIPIKKSI